MTVSNAFVRPGSAETARLRRRVNGWYREHARDLPWRAADASPWGVFVSEVMLQQTPVARVLPVWREWLRRWPEAPALAAEPVGEAIRAWGRLGYPRRAMRLHAAAVVLSAEFDGIVPGDEQVLRSLPGVGDYTAAAVAAFAFGRSSVVLDTNVRRVLGRVLDGVAEPRPTVSVAEGARARALLPAGGVAAARWSVGVMELGALVCTARAPACGECPLSWECGWLAHGRPELERSRPAQVWTGSDRHARGRLMAALRDAADPLDTDELARAWPEPLQRERALAGLVADGLAVGSIEGYRLP